MDILRVINFLSIVFVLWLVLYSYLGKGKPVMIPQASHAYDIINIIWVFFIAWFLTIDFMLVFNLLDESTSDLYIEVAIIGMVLPPALKPYILRKIIRDNAMNKIDKTKGDGYE